MRLPAMFGTNFYPEAAGLMSYGADYGVTYRHAATCVDKILKGAKPADLPVAQPESMVNMKTAKATGISIAREFPRHADKVIE
jgi:putative ABC transport system substrate-binding protein